MGIEIIHVANIIYTTYGSLFIVGITQIFLIYSLLSWFKNYNICKPFFVFVFFVCIWIYDRRKVRYIILNKALFVTLHFINIFLTQDILIRVKR